MKNQQLEKYDVLIETSKAEISEMEKTLFGEIGLKMSEKEYDKYFDKMVRKKKKLSKLQKERRVLYSKLLGYTETEKINANMIKTLCL